MKRDLCTGLGRGLIEDVPTVQ